MVLIISGIKEIEVIIPFMKKVVEPLPLKYLV